MATATVTATQITSPPTARATYEIAYRRPNGLRVTVSSQAMKGKRTVWANPQGVTLFDHASLLYTRSKWEAERSLGDNVLAANAMLDSMVLGLADPAYLKETLEGIRRAASWKRSSSGGKTTLTGTGPNGRAQVTFLEPDGRLGSLVVGSNDKQRLEWSFTYGPPPTGKLDPVLPKDARFVAKEGLTVKLPPKYADSTARTTLERTFDVYDRLRDVAYKVSSEDESWTVWLGEGAARQKGSRFDFSYRQGVFTLLDHRTRHFYTGKAKLSEIDRWLTRLGARWDPTARELMHDGNPIRILFSPEMTVRSAGSLTVDGANCRLLQGTAPKLRLSVLIRQSDGLVLRMSSQVLDERGSVLSATDRRFQYTSVRKRLPTSSFTIAMPAGFQSLPLATLPK